MKWGIGDLRGRPFFRKASLNYDVYQVQKKKTFESFELTPHYSFYHYYQYVRYLWLGVGREFKIPKFPTPETMGNLGTNLTRKVFWDRLGGRAKLQNGGMKVKLGT